MSIAAPVLSTSAAVPVVVSVAGGDLPSVAPVGRDRGRAGGRRPGAREPEHGHPDPAAQRRSFLLALVATVAVGVQLVLLSVGGGDRPAARRDGVTADLGARSSPRVALVVAAGRPAAGAARPGRHRPARHGGANVSYAAATTAGLLSVVAVLSSLYPVVTVGLAHRHLGERLAGSQRLGVVLALGGAALISAG